MAYFTETDSSVILMHDKRAICIFKKPTEEEVKNGTGATFDWSNETVPANQSVINQKKLTITTPGNLASFVATASEQGYSFEKYLFSQKDGMQVALNRTNGTFSVQRYKNGILLEEHQSIQNTYTHRKWDSNRGTYHIFTKETLEDGSIMRKSYFTYNNLKSQIKYSIKTVSGHLLEEGTLDANNQKHGLIMTYDKNGHCKKSYYENGTKLTLGQRLFGFKRKVTSHTTNQIAQQNELTR